MKIFVWCVITLSKVNILYYVVTSDAIKATKMQSTTKEHKPWILLEGWAILLAVSAGGATAAE